MSEIEKKHDKEYVIYYLLKYSNCSKLVDNV